MELGDRSKIKLNRRLFYFLVVLAIALPIIVGSTVAHLSRCSSEKDTTHAEATVTSTLPNTDSLSGKTTTPSPPQGIWNNIRLPPYIVPHHYNITLYPKFIGDEGIFFGNETIDFQVTNATHFILIHYKRLNVTFCNLTLQPNGEVVTTKRIFPFEKNEYLVIETDDEMLAKLSLRLTLRFEGSLTGTLVGFYKSTYVDPMTKSRRYLATTKFQPTYARRAFPCFDEPNMKAEFTINLIHKEPYRALSNMPSQKVTPVEWSPALVQTSFQRSKTMSTYLVCFIVCDFDYKNSTSFDGKPLRVFSTPDKINQTDYAMEVLKEYMEFYTKRFNLSYPLPKLDMVAIPDYISGATEHWGIITYRETRMLFDKSEGSLENKMSVAGVIAHEMAHMWFGNLVTMEWWDDIWLNEGFASFMQVIAVAATDNTTSMDQAFIRDTQRVMRIDAQVSSHPIVVPVDTPDEITAVFDVISYSKGAAVIRMLQKIIGEEDFLAGIQLFLKRFQWKSATTYDLWATLNEVQKSLDVKAVMQTWTNQMGYPVVNVSFEKSDPMDPRLQVTQIRFKSDPNADYDNTKYNSSYGYKWYIPLDYITSESKIPSTHWMNMTDTNIRFTKPFPDWIKFNVNQTGYYRVNYPVDMWQQMSESLQHGHIQDFFPLDRSGLLNDAFELASAGYLDYDIALNMTLYLDKEREYAPWMSVLGPLNYISKMLKSDPAFGLWRKYILSRATPVLNSLGWEEGELDTNVSLRNLIIYLTCELDEENCLNNASEKFQNWITTNKRINSNLRSDIYTYGMKNIGKPDDWDIMWNRYLQESIPQEQIKLLLGLSAVRTIWLLRRYITYAKDENKVRSQNVVYLLITISTNPIGNCLVWDWTRQNWDYLVKRFGLNDRYFGRLVPNIIQDFNTEFQLNEVLDFVGKYPDAGAGLTYRNQAIEKIRKNILWMKKSKPKIVAWLNKYHT